MILRSKKEFLYLGSILFILIIINYEVLDTWFIIDDTANIFCSSFDTIKLLFDRDTYLFFNQLFFTPLLPISFKIDWYLFRLNPIGYHLHNLIAAFLGCIFFYKIQRLYLSPLFSWLGTILLSISLPITFDIGWITRKHYLWGFSFALMALYLLKRWEVNRKNYLLFFSLIGALLSFLFKEAYAFLPAIIFIVSSGSLKERAKKTIPYIFILAIYIFWRVYMLGGLGGYPGSTDKSFLFLLNKFLHMPMDLSENLYGFSFFLFLLLIILALVNFKMLFLIALMSMIVISPFVFYPGGGFLLATKPLSFVAVISFTLSYIMSKLSLRHKGSLLIFLPFLILVLFGSISKIRDGQEVIIRLSTNYERASKEIMKNQDQKILIVGNYSYYFSNLEDIYRKMIKTNFPYITSISDIMVLPYLNSVDFDKVIVAKNFDLNPERASTSSIDVIERVAAKDFIRKELTAYRGKMFLSAPMVNFILAEGHLTIDIVDSRTGTYVRCVHMGSYVGCYPIPRKYIFKFNNIKKVERIDIIYISKDGIMSKPATFKGF